MIMACNGDGPKGSAEVLMDQEQAMLKHYCRICKKGFGCGRALGGHMRAHGIIEDPAAPDSDEDPPIGGGSEWEDKPPDHFSSGKTLYSLRPNASRARSHRVCENCGKEFLSWKSFLDHGRCNSDDELSLPSSPHSCEKEGSHAAGWNKGKRSQRPKPSPSVNWLSTEEEELANSLIMLSSAEVDLVVLVTEPEESPASTSKEVEDPTFLMRCAAEMSNPTWPKPPIAPITTLIPRGMFECKACKKVFNSHQALGGHRASHKKVKGCFAAKLDLDPYHEDDIDQIGTSSGTGLEIVTTFIDNPHPPVSEAPPLKKKSRVHECTICHRQFSSGQALGGHKRCHWITSSSGSAEVIPTTTANNFQHQMPEVGSSSGANLQDFSLRQMFDSSDTLDLNLPAPIDDLVRIPLRLDAPAAVYIKPPWNNIDSKSKLVVYDVNNDDRKVLRDLNPANLEDEAESKVEVAKLSDLKGMKVEEESSSWLQVGIGGTSAKRKGL